MPGFLKRYVKDVSVFFVGSARGAVLQNSHAMPVYMAVWHLNVPECMMVASLSNLLVCAQMPWTGIRGKE